MEWTDEGFVLGTRVFGENGTILDVLTRDHGRHQGLVHGGRSRKMQPVLQAGNRLQVTWRSRLDEALGAYSVEPLELNASRFLGDKQSLYALSTIVALLRTLPERDPHPQLYAALVIFIENLHDSRLNAALLAKFELILLTELGFGLDLSCCAATGAKDNLIYVSPKTGRSVSREAGEAYKNRLFTLPHFLINDHHAPVETSDIQAALALTGYFLERNVFEPRGLQLPKERVQFMANI